MATKMRVGVKAAWIISLLGLAGIIVTVLFSKDTTSSDSNTQNSSDQKVDNGSINNYKAGRDVKIENNITNTLAHDSLKEGPKNQVINNAPNQGTQIVGDKNVVNNYQGVRQRKLSTQKLNSIYSKILNPDMIIHINYKQGDKESYNLAKDLTKRLSKKGITNVYESQYISLSNCDFDSITCRINTSGFLLIDICPASNIIK